MAIRYIPERLDRSVFPLARFPPPKIVLELDNVSTTFCNLYISPQFFIFLPSVPFVLTYTPPTCDDIPDIFTHALILALRADRVTYLLRNEEGRERKVGSPHKEISGERHEISGRVVRNLYREEDATRTSDHTDTG